MSENQSEYFTESERLRNLKLIRSFELLFECQDSLQMIEKWKSESFFKTRKGMFDFIGIHIDGILYNKVKIDLPLVICLLSSVQKLMGEFIVSDGVKAMRVYSKLYMCEGLLIELNNELEMIKANNYRFA